MIFKTFDSDIDTWTSKIGILGKSFHELGEMADDIFSIYIDDITEFGNNKSIFDSIAKYLSTDDLSKKLIVTKSDIQSKLKDVDKLVPKINDVDAKSFLNIIQEIENGKSTLYKSFQDLYDSDESNQWIAEYAQKTQGHIRSVEDLKRANEDARQSIVKTNKSLKNMTIGAKAASVATKALAVAGNMLVSMAVSYAITKAVEAISNYINRAKIAHEETIELTNTYKDLTSQIEDLQDKLDELNEKETSITDPEDLALLKAESEELSIQLAILKEKQRVAGIDANKAAEKSLGMTQGSKYEYGELKQTYDATSGIVTVSETMKQVTKTEELENAMKAYDEASEKVKSLQEEQSTLNAETDKARWDELEKEITSINQTMENARSHANELATAIQQESEGLDGSTEESKALKTVINNLLPEYTNWVNDINRTTDALNENTEAQNNNAEAKHPEWDFKTAIAKMDDLKDKMSSVDEAYAKLFDSPDSGTFIGLDDYNAILDKFKDVEGLDINKHLQELQSAGQNATQVKSAIENLITSYLNLSGVLDGVTQENAALIQSSLTELGIANASEIVNAALSQSYYSLGVQKIMAANATASFATLTAAEIEVMIREAQESGITRQELALLSLQKQMCNETVIRTDGDIQNLQALARQAGATEAAIASIKDTQNRIATAGAGRLYSNNPEKAAKLWQDTYNDIFNSISNRTQLSLPQALTNGGKINIPKIDYNGGKAVGDAVKNAAKDAKDAADKAKDEFRELVDFFERRIKVLEDAFSNLETGMENVLGSKLKNELLSSQLGIIDEQINNYTDALSMYKQKADEALSGIDKNLQDKVVNGSVELIDFIGEGNEEVIEAMENYKNWSDKVSECTQKLEELKTQIRELELQKFNNIMDDYTDTFELYGDSIDLIDKQISLLEEAGELIGDSYYTKQIEQSQKQLNTLEEEKVALVKQLNDSLSSGRIQQGTDEWLEMCNALTEVEGNILDTKQAIEEFNNALLEIEWTIFERVQTEFGNLHDEMDNLIGLFEEFNDIEVSDGKGTWTDKAIATLGLYAQRMELAKYQTAQYSEAIEKLEQDYLNGRYSAIEYMDKLAELTSEQWDAVNTIKELEQAIIDLNEQRVNEEIESIEEEIDSFNELTDAQIENIEATEELIKKKQDLEEKSKSVEDIQRKLAAMQYDDTAVTIAKRKQLEEELVEAKKDLADTERQYSVDAQKEALEKQAEEYEKKRQEDIEKLEESLNNREQLLSDSFNTIKENANMIGSEIVQVGLQNGVIVSDALVNAWLSGENAIASYGETLSAQSSVFIGNIIGVQNQVYALQSQANTASMALSNMFATRADTLVNQLNASYSAESNLTNATNILKNSLINTLERGYNVSAITNSMGSIASSANSAAGAVNSLAGALSGIGSYSGGVNTTVSSSKVPTIGNPYEKYIDVDTLYPTGKNLLTEKEDKKKWKPGLAIPTRAKGGIITDKDASTFDPIAKAVGEDHIIAVRNNESVLTPKQTEAIGELAPTLEKAVDYSKVRTIPFEEFIASLGGTIPKGKTAYEYVSENLIPSIPYKDNSFMKPLNENITNNKTNTVNVSGGLVNIKGDFSGMDEQKVAKIAGNEVVKAFNKIERDYKIRH